MVNLVSVNCFLGLMSYGDNNMVDISLWGYPCSSHWNKIVPAEFLKREEKGRRKKKTPPNLQLHVFSTTVADRVLSLDRHACLMATVQKLIFKLPQTPVAPINETAEWARGGAWWAWCQLICTSTGSTGLYLLTQYFGLNIDSLCKVALKIKMKMWENTARAPQGGQVILFCLTLVSQPGASLSSMNMMEWQKDFDISCQGAFSFNFSLFTLYIYYILYFTSGCAMHHCRIKMEYAT